jgi:hypothetical protein
MRAAYALVLAVALSACGDDTAVEKKDASPAEVAKSVADAGMKLNPGRWEMKIKFAKFEVEGMPPEAKQAMQQMLGQERTSTSCLTKEEAEKPGGAFFGQQSTDCRYDTFTMGGGKIEAAMTCKGQALGGGSEAKIKMAGTYSPSTYDMTMDMQGAAPNGKSMNMSMAVASKHSGECKGDEES